MTNGPRSTGLLTAGGAVLIGITLLLAGCGDKEQVPVQPEVPPRHTGQMPTPPSTYPAPGYAPRVYQPEAAQRYQQQFRGAPPPAPTPPPIEYDDGGNPWAGRGYPQPRAYGGQGQDYGGYHRYRPLGEDRPAERRKEREPVPPATAPWPGGGYGFGYGYGYGGAPYQAVPYWGAPYWGGAPGFW